jgi:hypothetical protein
MTRTVIKQADRGRLALEALMILFLLGLYSVFIFQKQQQPENMEHEPTTVSSGKTAESTPFETAVQ